MVQEFNVLRCFSCKRFQVHQVKKAKKWICKVCGEKQSISKIYGQGSAPDCRRHVQKLNTIQGEREQLMGEKVVDDEGEEFDGHEVEVTDNEQFAREDSGNERDQAESKWKKFMEEAEKKNEETLEEEFLNGIPVAKDKKAFGDGTKKGKQPKNWRKNAQSNDEFLPQKKRLKSRDFENGEDEFQQRSLQKNASKNLKKVNGMKEKPRLKWDIFNSVSEEIPKDEEVPSKKYDGISISKPKDPEIFNLNDSPVNNPLNKSQNSTPNNIDPQAKRVSKTSQSKWSKFLGSSDYNHEEDEVKDRNDESYSRSDASENSQENRQLVMPGRLTRYNTMDANALENTYSLHNYSQCVERNANNASSFPIPSFVLNARATRLDQGVGKSTNSCQVTKEPSSFTFKDIFTIDDELGDEWWNV